MKLADRKNTTEKGLEELKKLVESIGSFASDIETVISPDFPAVFTVDNDLMINDIYYSDWTQAECYWRIKDGDIKLLSVDNRDDIDPDYMKNRVVSITNCKRISFEKGLRCLQILIERYNLKCKVKDAEIEKFLDFCVAYQGAT